MKQQIDPSSGQHQQPLEPHLRHSVKQCRREEENRDPRLDRSIYETWRHIVSHQTIASMTRIRPKPLQRLVAIATLPSLVAMLLLVVFPYLRNAPESLGLAAAGYILGWWLSQLGWVAALWVASVYDPAWRWILMGKNDPAYNTPLKSPDTTQKNIQQPNQPDYYWMPSVDEVKRQRSELPTLQRDRQISVDTLTRVARFVTESKIEQSNKSLLKPIDQPSEPSKEHCEDE
jgi:hypothetical protein